MQIFNTKSGKKEELIPLEEGHLKMYLCGPTVYDGPHLGHGRSAVAFDLIRRYFLYKGYKVLFVSNYTDVDDKMIDRAEKEGISVPELAEKVIPLYVKEYGALGIMEADKKPRATGHIAEMVEIIKKLEDKGFTYVLDDGVYFDVSKYEKYGELSGQNLEELQMGARVKVNEAKKNPYDFALWKFKKEGEPFWESPWGDGRPGWHIECSAMSYKHLGETFDIHCGGLDLVFPHHECEVAQSCGAFGEGSFAKYWLHNGFVNIDNEKMSKSLGNFFTLSEIFEKYDAQIVRLMFLQTHYRNPINFSDTLLEQSKAGLMRLHDLIRALRNGKFESDHVNEGVRSILKKCQDNFEIAMDDDFDSSGALGAVFELVRDVNVLLKDEALSSGDVSEIISFLEIIDKVLGVIFYEEESLGDKDMALIEEREQAREARDFERSDEIRDELLKRGIVLEDRPDGTIWKKI